MLCYFAHVYILWFYLNGGFHASDRANDKLV